MTGGISICEWIIIAISIPIECLRISRIRYHVIRANKPADSGILVAGAVVVETSGVEPLPCEKLVRGQGPAAASALAEAKVINRCNNRPAGIEGGGSRAQVVLQNIAQGAVKADRNQLATQVVV